MDSSKKVNDFQNLSDILSIQNTKGKTLDVQNDQKDTENCLKRFKQEYNELMKQKNENIQSIKSPIKNNSITSISSKIYSKIIESSNINLNSSDEFSMSNLTEMSSNNTIELAVEIDSDTYTINDSNIDIYQDLKKKENSFSTNLLKKKNNKKISSNYNNYNDQYFDKHGQCNKENLGCLHAESIIKNSQENQKNENIQKHEEDCIKFYGMLVELNNEIIKLKELFSNNTDSNSFLNTINFNNYNTNQSTDIIEMSAGEDFIDHKEYRSYQQNTFVEKMVHTNFTDHDLYSESEFDSNPIIFNGVNYNNKDCTNANCSMYSYNSY